MRQERTELRAADRGADGVETREAIQETSALHIDEKVEMTKKVSSDDGMSHVGDDEHPAEDASEAEGEREGTLSVGADRSAVG